MKVQGAYSYLKTDAQIADEIFSTILGNRGEAKYMLELSGGNVSLAVRLINAWHKFWQWVKANVFRNTDATTKQY